MNATSIPIRGAAKFVRALAKDARGAILGSSPVVAVSA